MRKILTAAALAATMFSGSAQAGIYGDDLTRCLVKSMTEADGETLISWMFGALSVNSTLNGAAIPEAERIRRSKDAAGLFQRLTLKDCRGELTTAVKYEGVEVLGGSFETLGQVAMRNLMSDAAVAAEFERITTYVDQSEWEKLAKDAGAAAPAKR